MGGVAPRLEGDVAPLGVHGVLLEVHGAGHVVVDPGRVLEHGRVVDPQVGRQHLVGRLAQALDAVDVDVGEPDVPGHVGPEQDVVGGEVARDDHLQPGVRPRHTQRRLHRDQLGWLVHVQHVPEKERQEYNFYISVTTF